MKLGFLGTGSITSAVVRGLCAAEADGGVEVQIVVSPRNAERAGLLAEEFDSVSIAADNQGLVDACDTVFVAVRPAIARELLESLRFGLGQRVVSFVPTLRSADLAELVEPSVSPVRVIPLPPCAKRRGCVVSLDADDVTAGLLRGLGEVLEVGSEREFHLLMATTALISPIYSVLAEAAEWARVGGVEADLAERYVAGMAAAICQDRLELGSPRLNELAREAATPGGLNESALADIRAAGGVRSFSRALDAIILRLGEAPPAGDGWE